MNIYVIFGVLLVAVGTVVTIVGTQRASREDSRQTTEEVQQQVDRALEALSAARSDTDDPASITEIDAAEAEFREWATEFITDRERRFNRLSQSRLTSAQNEIELSDGIRPFVREFIRVLEGLGSALSESEERFTVIDFPQLPLNLFDVYRGHIAFKLESKLVVEIRGQRPAERSPKLVIYFSAEEDRSDDFLIINPELTVVNIVSVGDKIPAGLFPLSIPNDPKSPALGVLVREIIELQLFLLEQD